MEQESSTSWTVSVSEPPGTPNCLRFILKGKLGFETNVLTFKKRIHELGGPEPRNQHLWTKFGIEIKNQNSLGFYNIVNGDNVTLKLEEKNYGLVDPNSMKDFINNYIMKIGNFSDEQMFQTFGTYGDERDDQITVDPSIFSMGTNLRYNSPYSGPLTNTVEVEPSDNSLNFKKTSSTKDIERTFNEQIERRKKKKNKLPLESKMERKIFQALVDFECSSGGLKGLTFPDVEEDSAVFLNEVLRVVISSVFRVVGDLAKENGKERIVPRHILASTRVDKQMELLLEDIDIWMKRANKKKNEFKE